MKKLEFKRMGLPYVTMFMLMSVDGKISTGDNEYYDFDRDLPKMESTKYGLHSYYELEKETAEWTISSGKTQVKVLQDVAVEEIERVPANILVVDSHHLTHSILEKLSVKFKSVVIATVEPGRFQSKPNNVVVEYFPAQECDVPLRQLMQTMQSDYGVREMCLQGGGDLNASFLRAGLVSELDIIVAPLVVGGRSVPGLVGGVNPPDLDYLSGLRFISADPLGDNYLRLRYGVLRG